jgi:colanic acid/amylovoran biosynthesis protein
MFCKLRTLGAVQSTELIKFKAGLRGANVEQMSEFLEALLGADLVVVSGGGDINDFFPDYAMTVLGLLETSVRHNIPTVMFGQGIGPIEKLELKNRAKAVLPEVDFISIREKRVSLPLLKMLGVEQERIITTGDDSIELAFSSHRPKSGNGIGVNFRVAPYSEATDEHIKTLGTVLRECSTRYGAALVPLPISFYDDESDVKTIRRVLSECGMTSNCGQNLSSPVKIVKQVSCCRIVVTGSYHCAVFAFSQGIPAVCLVKSAYYRDKFLGLADEFGCGCGTVFLDDGDLSATLTSSIEKVWNSSNELKGQLLAAAERQIAMSRSAYNKVYDLVESKVFNTRTVMGEEKFEHAERF